MPPQTNLEQSIDVIQNRLSAVVLSYMQTAGKRLKDISEIEDLQTYLYSAEFLDDTGKDLRKVQRELNKTHRENLSNLNSLFKTVTAEAYTSGQEMAERKDTRLSPLASYRQEASPLLRQVVRDYDTMSRSTTLNSDYKKTIRQYVSRLTMGDEDNAPTAMRKAIRELTAQGISTIDYQSGRSVRMDSAVRNSLMTEYTNIVQGIQNKIGQEIGADGWEISAHEHSALDHIDIQGRTFTNAEFEKLQNGEDAEDIEGNVYQTDRPIGMWNCRHLFFPVLIGISEPSFTNEQLEAMQERNEEGIDFDGNHYTLYEAEQQQRQLETAMRHERENLNLLKEVRETDPRLEHDYQKSKARLAELRNEYKELGAALEPKAIRMKWDRSYIPRGSTGGQTYQPPTPPPSFQVVSDEMRDKLQAQSDSLYSGFTRAESWSISSYSNVGYLNINDSLFSGNMKTPQIADDIKDIDGIMNKSIVQNDLVTFRGTSAEYFKDWNVDGVHEYKSFMSTSISKEVVEKDFLTNYTNKMLIEVMVPKGTKGLYLGTNSECDWEQELLLNRGMKYKVLEKTANYMKLLVQ